MPNYEKQSAEIRKKRKEGENPEAAAQESEQSNDGSLGKSGLQNNSSFFKELISILFSVILAYILFLLVRTFLFFPFQVVGDSMYPTLESGDRLILNRLATVDRFDVVVFPDPNGSGEEYVKRIIGLPGDAITFVDDQLYINGEPVAEEYLEPMKETLDGAQLTEDFTLTQYTGETKVPEGMYFVMGDNRLVSRDSRYFGFISADIVEGTTSLRIWPLSKLGFLEDYNEQ